MKNSARVQFRITSVLLLFASLIASEDAFAHTSSPNTTKSYTTLGPLGPYVLYTIQTSTVSYGTGINENGDVAGYTVNADGSNSAFLYKHGKLTMLGTLGGQSSIAIGINDHDVIVGTSQTGSGTWDAFVWKDGVMTDLGNNSGVPTATAVSINNSGLIAIDNFGGAGHGWLCQYSTWAQVAKSSCVELTAPGSAFGGIGSVLNNGTAAGSAAVGGFPGPYQAAFWSLDSPTAPLINGPINSNVTSGNDKGEFVGWGNGFSNLASLYWSSKTAAPVDLGFYFGGNGNWSAAYAINNNGVILGTSYNTANNQDSYLAYSGSLLDLTALLQFTILGSVTHSDQAQTSLNQQNAIAGSVMTSNGYRAAILAPSSCGDLSDDEPRREREQ